RRQQLSGLPIAHSPATLPRQRGVYGDRAFLSRTRRKRTGRWRAATPPAPRCCWSETSQPTHAGEVTMIKEAIVSSKLAPPAGPFSAAIRSGGFVYLSGQIGQDPASGKLIEGGIEKQTEQIFSNLAAVLEAAGKSFNDVVRAGVYLTNIGD